MKKLLLTGVLSLLACAGAFATDIVTISFNFYSAGEIVLDGKAPEGVTICRKIRFHNPKLFGFAFPVQINLDKTKSVELKFKVKGGSGKMEASVSLMAVKDGKKLPVPTLKCTEFELNEEEANTPFTFKKWKGVKTIMLEDGDTITIKASFDKAE